MCMVIHFILPWLIGRFRMTDIQSDGLFEAIQMDGRDITSLKTARFMRQSWKRCSRCGT
jgi:hypothetical protein